MDPLTYATASTTTIKVITRHSKDCKKQHPRFTQDDNSCNCRKALYIYENGKDKTISAKTRSQEKAEALARQEWDLRDPVKRALREIEEREAAKEAAAAAAAAERAAKALTIEEATCRWLKYKKPKKQSTARIHNGVVNRIRNWANDNNIKTVADVTFDELDKWRGEWGLDAEKAYNRIGPTTQSTFQRYLKSFFRYIVGLGYLEKDPATNLERIKENSEPAQPLTPSQFEELLAAIEPFCRNQTGIVHKMAAEIRAEFLLQRWTGLRIGDSIAFQRSGLVGNRITLVTQKTGAHIESRAIADAVAAELAALPESRPNFRKGYFLWLDGRSTVESLESFWDHRIIGPLNSYLRLFDERGKPMWFHSHMLRDTYAVELLLQGMDIVEVAKLLTHTSVKVTEKHYAPWVKSRMEKLENNSVAAMQRMGMQVTI
jgi:integrase